MFEPLVSIVIPVYNGANYLREAVGSALAQTYPHCEILVVNDGSTDGGATEAIALSYGEQIRYFVKENGGVASALNMGIENMRGDFFSWLSHDDVYMPEKLSHQIDLLSRLSPPPEQAFVFSNFAYISAQGQHLWPAHEGTVPQNIHPMLAVFQQCINGCTVLIHRDLFSSVGLFKALPTTQDYDMWFRMARRAKFIYSSEITVLSRLHDSQGFRTEAARQEADVLWLRLLHDITPQEICAFEDSEETFFAHMGKVYGSMACRAAYCHAWSRATARERWLWRLKPQVLLKEIMYHCGILYKVQEWRSRRRIIAASERGERK